MRFAHPQILFLLMPLLLGLAVFLVWSWRKKQRLITRFVQERLLEQLTVGVSKPRQKARLVLFGLAVACAGVALARPQWGFAWEEAHQRGLDIVVAIDTSRSMLADDTKPNRMERAKFAALDLFRIARSDRLGLVPFAGTAFLQCPLTLDADAFRQNVQVLHVGILPQGGTALAGAIEVARHAFKDSQDNTKVLVLLTDGEDHDSDAVAAARDAAKAGVRIFTVGVGTAEGEVLRGIDDQGRMEYIRNAQGEVVKSKLNQALLQQLATEAGGFYLPLQSANAVDTLYAQGLAGLAKSDLASRLFRRYHEKFYWPLGIAVALLLAELFFPERARLRARSQPTGLTATAARAIIISLLFAAELQAVSPDRALKDYQAGHYDEARQTYEKLLERRPDDPRVQYNLGTAAYQAQDYTNAIRVLGSATQSPDLALQQRALFNLGDALYRRGEQVPDRQSKQDLWNQAVQNFEAAVKLNPQDSDAEFNRKFVERKIKELEEQQPPPQNSGKQDQSQQPDSSDPSNQSSGSNQSNPSQGQESSLPSDQTQPPDPSQRSEPSQEPKPSEQPDPSPQSDQPQKSEPSDPSQEPKPSQSAGRPDESDQPEPSKEAEPAKSPGSGEAPDPPKQPETPLPQRMNRQQAQQMLDAVRGDERPMLFQPHDPKRSPSRGFKDW